ncbi:MAG: biopolymer transporter ExbD [Alphaproteobacteria bacterium]|nr:biopolymer transporter ExbD [Alphaproteobacteria bacterium]
MAAQPMRSRGGAGRRRYRPVSEINVTPFVDVMLVLLVVFMVTAPLLVLGVPVQLPKVGKEFIIADEDQPLNVEVDQDKRVYLNKTEITLATLTAKLQGVRNANPDVKVHLRADARLNYGAVAVVAGEIRNAGIQVIALRTDLASKQREIEAFPEAVTAPTAGSSTNSTQPGGG